MKAEREFGQHAGPGSGNICLRNASRGINRQQADERGRGTLTSKSNSAACRHRHIPSRSCWYDADRPMAMMRRGIVTMLERTNK